MAKPATIPEGAEAARRECTGGVRSDHRQSAPERLWLSSASKWGTSRLEGRKCPTLAMGGWRHLVPMARP